VTALEVSQRVQHLAVVDVTDQVLRLLQTLLGLLGILEALVNDPELALLFLLKLALELLREHQAAAKMAFAVLGVKRDRLLAAIRG
jgi:hypothetical protein